MPMLGKRSLTALVISLLAAGLAGCDAINPEEEIPSYIHIDSIALADEGNNPTNTFNHDIEDAWVIADGQFIGVYQLPATIPILQSGRKQLSIRAGIRNNGISNTRTAYPFYDTISLERNLKRKEVDTLGILTTNYIPGDKATFEWTERFEDTGDIALRNNTNASVPFQVTGDEDEVLSGDFSLKADFENEAGFFEVRIPERKAVRLGQGNRNIFLEVSFKTNTRFQVGIIATAPNGNVTRRPKLVLNETQGRWNKVYINLRRNVQRFPDDHRFQVFFGKRKDQPGPATLYLDNLKLITR